MKDQQTKPTTTSDSGAGSELSGIVIRLRNWFKVDESVSDGDVLEMTKGTFGRACVELGIAQRTMKEAIWSAAGADLRGLKVAIRKALGGV